jgi:tetratricopeptide (TPR) repeat protein
LYADLDEIYTQTGDAAAREKLLAGAPADVQDKDTVRTRKALLYVQIKQYDKALEVFRGHNFKPWEGGLLIRQLFVLANLEKGRQALASQQYALADQAFREALRYPENLGVGKPDKPQDEEALYWLGKTLEAEGKKDAARAAWQEAVGEGSAGNDYPERGGNAQFYFALALDQLGRSDEAAHILDRLALSVANERGSAFDYYLAGLVEGFREHNGQAFADFRRAVQLDPSLWQPRIEMEREGPRK